MNGESPEKEGVRSGVAGSWREIERLLAEDAPDRAVRLLLELPAVEATLALAHLTSESRASLLDRADADDAARLIGLLPDAAASGLLKTLTPETAAAIVEELDSANQADVLARVDPKEAESILERLPPADARQLRTLGGYPADVAGGLMVTEYLAFSSGATVEQVVDDFRSKAEQYRNFIVQYPYVVDGEGKLVGVLRLRDLLLAPKEARVADLMIRDPLTVADTTPLEDLRALFRRHTYFGVPVLDSRDRLVGLVRRSAVDEALAERTESEYLKTQGIVGGEELRSMPLMVRARRRLGWLSVNILLNVVAASVIALHQDTLTAVIALAVFLPIISDMSGCAGNQAVAVSMREVTLGLAAPSDVARVWLKEVSVGLVNGLALGLLIGLVALLWKGNVYLGLVVGTAMMINTVVAVSIGGSVPLLLKRIGRDPALASGPILTTITDMCGFFLVLAIAAAMLEQLR